MAVIPELGRLRQENHEIKTSLCYRVRPCLKKNIWGLEIMKKSKLSVDILSLVPVLLRGHYNVCLATSMAM
jgi:hypothetical protein